MAKRQVVVNGREYQVELSEGQFRAGKREGSFLCEEVQPGVYSVLLDGRSYRVHRDGTTLFVEGEPCQTRIVDPREYRPSDYGGGTAGRFSLRAPMPGRVIRVLLAPGAAVLCGQGILVMEAMKMQNELKSPKDGVLAEIPVGEGSAVSAGDVLAVIE